MDLKNAVTAFAIVTQILASIWFFLLLRMVILKWSREADYKNEEKQLDTVSLNSNVEEHPVQHLGTVSLDANVEQPPVHQEVECDGEYHTPKQHPCNVV